MFCFEYFFLGFAGASFFLFFEFEFFVGEIGFFSEHRLFNLQDEKFVGGQSVLTLLSMFLASDFRGCGEMSQYNAA